MRNPERTTTALRRPSPCTLVAPFACCLLFSLADRAAGADDKKPAPADRRTSVGKVLTPSGSLVWREGRDKPWHVAKEGDPVHTGNLLLAIPFAFLDVKGGARLDLLADLEKRTPFPIIESAVVLHDNPSADLDFTLDRGRVLIANRKEMGPARVRVRFRDEVWDLSLEEPGTRVGMEIFGRWPRGSPFTPEPKPEDVPALNAVLLVVSGQAMLKVGAQQYRMKPAPGPALFQWDSVRGPDDAPHFLRTPPAWAEVADLDSSPELRKKKAGMERFRQALVEQGIEAAVDEFLNSDDPIRRRAAIYVIGALDLLPRLGQALMTAKHDDVWDNAVIAMRHWIGRGPGQDQQLYRRLIDVRKMSPGRAAIVLQLLHGFGEEETTRPELYELLIEYLKDDQQAIRGLAHWHLVRLAPAGAKIPYRANAPQEERDKAYEAWKKLVPNGQLPPRPPEKD